MKLFKRLVYRLRGEYTTEALVAMGMTVGKNLHRMRGVILDPGHCWLITLGDNVGLATGVQILCHDASTKPWLGHTRIGRVTVGDNVFIGAGTIVLPGVTIGDNVIVGVNSTVSRDIPPNTVAVGSPAAPIMTLDEFLDRHRAAMERGPVYDESFTLRQNVPMEKRLRQRDDLADTCGYIV